MRSIISFTILASIIFSTTVPSLAQRAFKPGVQKTTGQTETIKIDPIDKKGGQKPDKPVQSNPKEKTEFDVVDAVSDGNGAWIRWRMVTEVGNVGFRVYRLGKKGETPVSKFIPGSFFVMGDRPLLGGEYNYFDPHGSQEAAYFVEAISEKGKTKRTAYLVPTYVESIDAIPDGNKVKAEAFAPKAGDNKVSQDLEINSELKAEMQLALLTDDPTRHREVISTPGGVRIASKADGLIRVTKGELQGAGFDVNSNSANWQIYLNGVELPMIIGNNSDYIEFLGKSINTLESDIRTYYLIPGASAGRRLESRSVRPPLTNSSSKKYEQTFVRADKKNYASQVLNGEAENWWGDVVFSTPFNYTFSLSGIDRTPGTRKMTLAFQGLTFSSHVVELTLNGTPLPNISGSGQAPFQGTIDVPVSSLLDGTNTLQLRATGPGADVSLLAKLSINFPRGFVAIGNKLNFYTENYKNARLSGFSSSNVRVFDVTYEDAPTLLTNLDVVQSNGTWGPVIPAARSRVLYAVENGAIGSALSVTPNDPSILSDPSNVGTMVIISHPSLMAEATTWANYRSGQGIATKVVDVTDIYDEFSYGTLSSHAIEDFLFYAKNNWVTPPSYVLLMGDGHYDSKNYDERDTGYWNMVPPRIIDTLYLELGSDEALSDFNGDGLAEIPIGRIPARTGDVVTNAFNKMVAWESSLTPSSIDRGVIFAYDRPNGYNFKAMSERVLSNIAPAVPRLSVPEAICTDDTNVATCSNNPNGNTDIKNAINSPDGKFILNYTGHGSTSFWSRSTFFAGTDVTQLTNTNRPIIITALTCLNGYFMTDFDSFAESMIKPSNGGAAAVWASTGETTPDIQEIMATRFYQKLNDGSIPRIGDLIKDAKAQVPAGADVRLSWALIGDPMLKVR